MTEFNKRQASPRFGKPHLPALAIVLAVCGITFAAGGFGWWLTVEINGTPMDVELDENGQASFTLDTEDGGTATVEIQKAALPGDGDMTELRITETNGEEESAVVEKVVRRSVMPEDELTYTLEDLGDAEPAQQWMDEQGVTNAVYFVPDEKGGTQIFQATIDQTRSVDVMRIGVVPFQVPEGRLAPQVLVEDDGTLAITFDKGQGEVRVIKIRRAFGAEVQKQELRARTPGAEVAVPLHDIEPQQ